MPSIYVKDELRAAVEAASGGQQTVLYTASGQPSIMNVIPKFNLEDIDASLGVGVHPAFIVGGVEKSELFVGAYPGIAKNDEFLSLPGVEPTVSLNHDAFVDLARRAGPGWHCITNAEWAALALWCWKNKFFPRGNTDYGRSHTATWETARRINKALPGDSSSTGRTLTGSGPVSWRHDNSPNGISDLYGNIHEWTIGVRLVDGEIQVIPDNDAALSTTNFGRSSTAWRAILAKTGELVAPGTVGTIKYDATQTVGGNVVVSNMVKNHQGPIGDDSVGGTSAVSDFSTLEVMGLTVPPVMKALALYPVSSAGVDDSRLNVRNFGERFFLRGGYWGSGANSGLFSANIIYGRGNSFSSAGSRPAFIL